MFILKEIRFGGRKEIEDIMNERGSVIRPVSIAGKRKSFEHGFSTKENPFTSLRWRPSSFHGENRIIILIIMIIMMVIYEVGNILSS